MARSERLIRTAFNASSETDPACTFLIGAAVAFGNRVISTGTCSTKTHPQNPKVKAETPKTQLCAEISAVLHALRVVSKDKIKKCSIYVARQRRDGTTGIARPCIFCQTFLRELGIKNVFYTTSTGCIEQMEI